MKIRTEKYEYTKPDETGSQYGTDDFSDIAYVDARYIHSDTYPGNPYVEALPLPKTSEQCMTAYNKTLINYDPVSISKMSDEERIRQLPMLRQLRLPMPYDSQLEADMYNALCQSYGSRYTLLPESVSLFSDKSEPPKSILCRDQSSGVAGFSMLGASGTGKSSTLDILRSHYPQVIRHPTTKGRMTQIVYLQVCCPPNSNFQVLYTEIGAEIDKALGYTNRIYEDLVRKSRNKFTTVKSLIETFAIGVIIFDEIQEINFSHTKTNSFASLTTLSQITGVAIAVAGLESAYQGMFKYFYTGRRVGTPINTNLACNDEQLFRINAILLFQYQWFDKRIEINLVKPDPVIEELIHGLFVYSCGVIDALVTMYTLLHIEYFKSPKSHRSKVDIQLLETVINKYYGKLKDLLAVEKKKRDKEGDFDADFIHLNQAAKDHAEALTTPSQLQAMNQAIKRPERLEQAESLVMVQQNVLKTVQSAMPSFSKKDIVNALNKLLAVKKNRSLSDAELAEKVILSLLQNKKPSASFKKKADVESMRQNLLKFQA